MLLISKLSGFNRQIIAGGSASLSVLAGAAIFGWITPSLPRLLSHESEIPMTSEEASWMVSMAQFGNLFSPIPAGVLADLVGRKTVIMSSGPLFLIGWVIVIYFKTLMALNIARFIQGIGVGIVYTVVPMYLGEIATPKFRGTIVSMFYNFWWFGYLLEYIIGSFLSFEHFTYVTPFTNIIFIIAFAWQPESPYFYVLKNDVYRAEKSLSWFLSTTTEEVSLELIKIKHSIEHNKENKAKWTDLVTNHTHRKCVFLLLLIGFVRMFCGLISLASYSTLTLLEAGDHFFLSPKTVTIVMGVMMFVGTLLSSLTLDLLGRVYSLLISSVISALCLFSVGTYYLLLFRFDLDMSSLNWIPHVGLIVFCASSTIGIFPVNAAYQSELFDTNTRATASSIFSIYATAVGLIPYKLYLPIAHELGIYVNLYIFTFGCLCGVISCTVLPETKGMSFEEIRELMQKGRLRK